MQFVICNKHDRYKRWTLAHSKDPRTAFAEKKTIGRFWQFCPGMCCWRSVVRYWHWTTTSVYRCENHVRGSSTAFATLTAVACSSSKTCPTFLRTRSRRDWRRGLCTSRTISWACRSLEGPSVDPARTWLLWLLSIPSHVFLIYREPWVNNGLMWVN